MHQVDLRDGITASSWQKGSVCIFASLVGAPEISGSENKISPVCEQNFKPWSSCFHVSRLCLGEKQEASPASKLPVLQLCSPSSVRKEQTVRYVRETQANHKALTSCQRFNVDEVVSDLLLPSVSSQPVCAAEGRSVTVSRLHLKTSKEEQLHK